MRFGFDPFEIFKTNVRFVNESQALKCRDKLKPTMIFDTVDLIRNEYCGTFDFTPNTVNLTRSSVTIHRGSIKLI